MIDELRRQESTDTAKVSDSERVSLTWCAASLALDAGLPGGPAPAEVDRG